LWFDLHHGWTVRACGDLTYLPAEHAATLAAGVPATVPGTVHTDLLAAGLIPDPYLDRNENELQWIGLTDWRYETTFDLPARGNVTELVFEGLDTVAEIELNHRTIASTRNMHRSYRFRTGDLLEQGNELAVTFTSAVRYARAERDRLGDLPNLGNDEPSNFLRKMACNFGWDWGPKLVTAGLWRRAGIEVWDLARLRQVRPRITVDNGDGVVTIHAEVDRIDQEQLRIRASVGGVSASASSSGEITLRVPKPDLWWPHSLGAQPLYALEVILETADGTRLDSWTREIGFRTIELDTTPDEIGSRFTLKVNGTPIFVRGANWIPDDCFPHRVDAARYTRRVTQARDANIDLLRVWGGGLYESDDFYDVCSRLGILVWQDFLFSCAGYPEQEPLYGEIDAEAREAVARLSPHASLALWCGNNENYMGWFHWGWREKLAGQAWGAGYYEKLLPTIVSEVDPTRPYIPGSPWSGSAEVDALDNDHGCVHLWDVWNERDYTTYRERVPRFVSEFGWQGPPTWATLTESIHDSPLSPLSPGVLHHQKAQDGNGKLWRGLAPHFPEPATFDDWHYFAQVNQARAMRLGIEHFRSHRPRCMGTIVWQLNDCWPVTSWAAIDGAERLKPLWFALRDAYRDTLLTIQPRDNGLAVVAVNDSTAVWESALRLRQLSLTGEVLKESSVPLRLAPFGTAEFPLGEVSGDVLCADTGTERTLWFVTDDLATPSYDTAVRRTSDGYDVTVTARTLVRDLALFPDRLTPDATVDQCLVTLLPGDQTTFHVTTTADLPESDLTHSPVLRCIGDTAS
jgi:beta-mannosidase